MKIYGAKVSGNCLKIKYVCDYLGIPYDWREIHLSKDKSKTETQVEAQNKVEMLGVNPTGEVPTVILDDGRGLSQSNAIMLYLAHNSKLIPEDLYLQAKMNEWLFWEQYSHEPYIAVCISHMYVMGRSKVEREDWRVENGEKALQLMTHHLEDRSWFIGDDISLADISLLAYTRKAHYGGFTLEGCLPLTDWISRCEAELGI